jgi:hypothetical protein
MSTQFNVFHYTCNSFDTCCKALDTVDSKNASDLERREDCKNSSQCICWPFCIVFDLISCPYRCPKHYIFKYNQPKEPEKTTSHTYVIGSQPLK